MLEVKKHFWGPTARPRLPWLRRSCLRSTGDYTNTQKKKNALGGSSSWGQIFRGGYEGFERVFVLE